jgi:SHS2 domain-containing protein
MAHDRKRWDPASRASAYAELEHPADLFLEIRGEDPTELLEHALFAFYDQIAEIEGFEARRELTLSVHAAGLDEALRSLLSEALYRFDTEGFVAVGGGVTIEAGPEGSGAGGRPNTPDRSSEWRLSARLWGDDAGARPHVLLHEVKAVTYHRLSVTRSGGDWIATVLLDI